MSILTNKIIPSQLENLKLNRRPFDPTYYKLYKNPVETVKPVKVVEVIKDNVPNKSQNIELEYSQISVKSQSVNLDSQLSQYIKDNHHGHNMTASVRKLNSSQAAKPKNNKRNKKSKAKFGRKKKNPSELIEIDEDEHDIQFDDSDGESQSIQKINNTNNINNIKNINEMKNFKDIKAPRNPQTRSHLQYLIENNLLKKAPLSENNELSLNKDSKALKILSQAGSENTQTNIEQLYVKIINVIHKDENNAKYLVKVEGFDGENILSVSSTYFKYFDSDSSYYLRIRRCGSHDPNSSNPPRIHFNCFGIAK